ncbi:hypothetical protein [Bacillus sp. ISL-46]|uniref:hypothetical protein n=1 Tax=Bacillus sp. ISL-46 TaxID=2819129 RepID=UPI001BE7DCC8|nr:hypothetical protein [Bacillus sp. ISL-46]MBT2725007.1 hypothetical protein [Bacillus sp. ISL-46]
MTGIGKATVEGLTDNGAKAVIFDIDEDRTKKTDAKIDCEWHYCGVSNFKLVKEEIIEVETNTDNWMYSSSNTEPMAVFRLLSIYP